MSKEMDEMAQQEFVHNLAMLERVKRENPSWTPCQIYYRMKKGIPLQVFKRVYPFDELVNCNFKLEELLLLRDLYQHKELEQELGVSKKSFTPLKANLEDLERKIEEKMEQSGQRSSLDAADAIDKVLYAKQLKQSGYSPSRVYEIIYGHMYGARDFNGTGSAFKRIPYDFRNVYTADEILHYFPENVLEQVYGKRDLEQALYRQRAAAFKQKEMRKLKKGVNTWANARDEDEEIRMFSRLPEQSPEKIETDIYLQEMARKREDEQMIQEYLKKNPAALQKKEQLERDYPQYLLQNPQFAQQVKEEQQQQQQRFGGRINKKTRSTSRSNSRHKSRSKSRSNSRHKSRSNSRSNSRSLKNNN